MKRLIAAAIVLLGFSWAEAGYGQTPNDPATLTVSIYGAPPEADTLRRYAELGVTRAIFALPSAGADAVLPLLDRGARVAREVG